MQTFTRIIIGLVACLACGLALSKPGSHTVRPHVTKQGTYVPAHRATNPDGSKLNNWSTKGNVNPYTGKPGTKDPNKPKRH